MRINDLSSSKDREAIEKVLNISVVKSISVLENKNEYHIKLLYRVSELDEAIFDTLPEGSQKWYNSAVDIDDKNHDNDTEDPLPDFYDECERKKSNKVKKIVSSSKTIPEKENECAGVEAVIKDTVDNVVIKKVRKKSSSKIQGRRVSSTSAVSKVMTITCEHPEWSVVDVYKEVVKQRIKIKSERTCYYYYYAAHRVIGILEKLGKLK